MPSHPPTPLRRGSRLQLQVEKVVPGGAGLARHEGRVVFVRLGLAGSTVEAEVTKVKSSFAEARYTSTISPAPNQVAPVCPHFFTCGGCSFQHLPYDAQLAMKEGFVREAITGIAKLEVPVLPIVPSPEQWHYRNKVEFSFGKDRALQPTLGYKLPGQFDRVFSVSSCPIFDPRADGILAAAQRFVASSGVPVYDGERRGGTLQYLVLRRSVATGELLVNLTLRTGLPRADLLMIGEQFCSEVLDAQAEPPAHVVLTLNSTGVSPQGRVDRVALRGRGELTEELGGLRFTVSPSSFFQTNTRGAEQLYALVRTAAGLTGSERLLDLYCGTGTIGQVLARDAREVLGIELNPEAVADANANAAANGLTRYRAVAGDVHRLITQQPELVRGSDVVVVDPPRAGLEGGALEDVRAIAAARLVYVSCNPATLARDLALLATDYDVLSVQPVDLFPHTPHTEAVATLVRRGARD